MHSSTDRVVLQVLHLEGLRDDTLTGEGSISVDLNRDDSLSGSFVTSEEMLLSSSSTGNDGVNSLEMRRVG